MTVLCVSCIYTEIKMLMFTIITPDLLVSEFRLGYILYFLHG